MAVAAIPFILAGLSAASVVVQSNQQKAFAEAQAKAQDQNNKAIRASAIQQYDDLSRSERDAIDQADLESLEQQKLAIQAQGRVNVMSGASGTYGGSVDSVLQDLVQTRGKNIAAIRSNRDTQLEDIRIQSEGIRFGARARQGNRVFAKPRSGIVALQAVTAGVGSYAQAGGRFGSSPPPDTGGNVRGG